jgi:hypothetical protein
MQQVIGIGRMRALPRGPRVYEKVAYRRRRPATTE